MNWSMLCCQYLHFVFYFLYTSRTFQWRKIIPKKKRNTLQRFFESNGHSMKRQLETVSSCNCDGWQQCKSECTWWWQQWLIKVLKFVTTFQLYLTPGMYYFHILSNGSFLISHVSLNLFYRKDACSDKFLVLTLHYLLELSM